MLVRVLSRKFFGQIALTASLLMVVFVGNATDSQVQVISSGDDQVTLIELFTSQGCSSCPPAENWLGELKDDPRLWKEIVPVAFHVDYWDYIGWKDSYAKPENSTRQRRYQGEGGVRSIYTPGFVVNGQEWRGWFAKRRLPVGETKPGNLRVELNGRQLRATFESDTHANQVLRLDVALLGIGLEVDVKQGENAGRTLSQDFTVLKHISLESSGRGWETTLPAISTLKAVKPAIAIWVSGGYSLKPIQAAGGWITYE